MRRRHKLDAPISGIIDARTSIKMVEKKETREDVSLLVETQEDLKNRWESHRRAFETYMELLEDPANPNNASWTEQAQSHLSSLLAIQVKLNEKSESDDKKGKGKGEEKTKESCKGEDTDGKGGEGSEK